MGTFCLWLSLSCLLAASNGNQLCDELQEGTLPKITEVLETWGLVAKSSCHPKPNYQKKLLQKARLEISKNGEQYTVKEILTAPEDITVFELKYDAGKSEGAVNVESFKTEKNLLLLGIEHGSGKVLYLASKTAKVRRDVLEKFEKQSLCFGTNYTYLFPGSIDEKIIPVNICEEVDKYLSPVHFNQSLGLWGLMVSAYANAKVALFDVKVAYNYIENKIVNDKPHMDIMSIQEGLINRVEIELTEDMDKDGHSVFRENLFGSNATMHSFGSDCIMFKTEVQKNQGAMAYLYCRPKTFSRQEIQKFVIYSHCHNAININIRRYPALACSDVPREVKALELEKIAGKWRIVSAASTYGDDIFGRQTIQFNVNDGKVTFTIKDNTVIKAVINKNRLRYERVDGIQMEMGFFEPVGEVVLVFINSFEGEPKSGLLLASKSGHVDPAVIEKFNYLASCLTLTHSNNQ